MICVLFKFFNSPNSCLSDNKQKTEMQGYLRYIITTKLYAFLNSAQIKLIKHKDVLWWKCDTLGACVCLIFSLHIIGQCMISFHFPETCNFVFREVVSTSLLAYRYTFCLEKVVKHVATIFGKFSIGLPVSLLLDISIALFIAAYMVDNRINFLLGERTFFILRNGFFAIFI